MLHNRDTSHIRNIEKFGLAIKTLIEMGSLYNPHYTEIHIRSLLSKRNAIIQVFKSIEESKYKFKLDFTEREIAINQMIKKTSKIANYVIKIATIPKSDINSVLDFVRDIKADTLARKANPENEYNDKMLETQLRYDRRIANFEKLITLLATIPEYMPKFPNIEIHILIRNYSELENLNRRVNATIMELNTIRYKRDELLYMDEHSILKCLSDIKHYLKTLYNLGEPANKAITKLRFVNFCR